MNIKISCLLLGFLTTCCSCEDDGSSKKFWLEVGFQSGRVLRECLTSTSNNSVLATDLLSCLRKRSLLILQRSTNHDIISLGGSLKLVKWTNNTTRSARECGATETAANLTYDRWKNEILETMANVFETHTLKINGDLERVSNAQTEGRGRKKGYMEFYVFSIVALSTVMIPMGFKFLAVLGGKAILLAKMALLLASIQGLKKLATSDINYGLYQAPPLWYGYDRKSQDYQHYPEDYNYQNYPSAPNYPYVR